MENNALIFQQPGTLQAVQGFTSGLFERWIASHGGKERSEDILDAMFREFRECMERP